MLYAGLCDVMYVVFYVSIVSVLSFRCCTFVSCVHPVSVLNAVSCMTQFVNVGRGYNKQGILQRQYHASLVDNHECLPHPVAVSVF